VQLTVRRYLLCGWQDRVSTVVTVCMSQGIIQRQTARETRVLQVRGTRVLQVRGIRVLQDRGIRVLQHCCTYCVPSVCVSEKEKGILHIRARR
jgi:hypothetical protein